MNTVTWAVLLAGCVASGLVLLAREVLLPAHPDLRSTVSRLEGRTPIHTTELAGAGGTLQTQLTDRVGRRLAAQAGTSPWLLGTSREDLALLGHTAETVMVRKAIAAVVGLLAPAAAVILFALVGLRLPVTVPAVLGLVAAAGGWVLIDIDIRDRANRARAEYRRALCSYVDLVALMRRAGAATSDALESAAGIADGWVFDRLRDTLRRGQLAGLTPWDALEQQGRDTGMTELEDLAGIMRLTSESGVAVYESLLTKAKSLRGAILTEESKSAIALNERLALGPAMLAIIVIIWIAYPGFAQIAFR